MIGKAGILAVLILVLGISSMAWGLMLVVGDGTTFTDPGNEVSIEVNSTIWIGIYDYVGEMYKATITIDDDLGLVEWTGNSAVYSPPAISTAPGWTHEIDGLTEWWFVDLSDPGSTEKPLPGVGCALELCTLSEGSFEIILTDFPPPPYWSGDDLIVNVIPEPATVLLVGLGGLALVRCGRCRRADKNR